MFKTLAVGMSLESWALAEPTQPLRDLAASYLKLDWVSRHQKLARWPDTEPSWFQQAFLRLLSPCQALGGTATGKKVQPGEVIAVDYWCKSCQRSSRTCKKTIKHFLKRQS